MKQLSITIILFILLATSAIARPVSYPDGWTIMQYNDEVKSRAHIHYSPNAEHSIGAFAEYFHDDKITTTGMQWNYLAYRRNTKNSQANFYLKNSLGAAFAGGNTEPYISTKLSADWETRRIFTAYEAEGAYMGDFDDGSFRQTARIGVAPYVGDYGDLHTWIMLEARHEPEAKDKFTLTPIIRFFKGDYLAEIGISENKNVTFNWIVRF